MAQLGEMLLERDWVTPQQLHLARRRQTELGGRIGTCLLEIGAISEDLLLRSLSQQAGVPRVPIRSLHDIPSEVAALLPPDKAVLYRAIPFRQFGGQIEVALEEVSDLHGQDELSFLLGKRVHIHIANEVRIAEALDNVYGHPCSARMKQLLARLNQSRAFHGGASTGPTHSGPATDGAAEFDSRLPKPRLAPPALGQAPGVLAPGVGSGSGPTLRTDAVDSVLARGSRSRPIQISAYTPHVPPAAVGLAVEPRAVEPEMVELAEPSPTPVTGSRGPEHGDPTVAPSPAELEFEERLIGVGTGEELGELLVENLAEHFIRVVLFRLGDGSVRGWLARGGGLDVERIQRYVCPLAIPSVFLTLEQGGGFFLGRLPGLPAHRRLTSFLESAADTRSLLVPIRLADRLVATILIERAESDFSTEEVERVRRLAAQAELAFRIVILRDKIRGLSRPKDGATVEN